MADEPSPTEPKAEPKAHAAKTVTLAVAWPVTEHTHGKHVITQEGTEVPADEADDIITAATTAGATIRKVS